MTILMAFHHRRAFPGTLNGAGSLLKIIIETSSTLISETNMRNLGNFFPQGNNNHYKDS